MDEYWGEVEKENTGVMVAFFLSPEVQEYLAEYVDQLPDGAERTDKNDLHLTLAYLPDVDRDGKDVGILKETVQDLATHYSPVSGQVGGVGRFATEWEGKQPVHTFLDSPDLPRFRQHLVDALGGAGLQVSRQHGFIPHVTLGYVKTDERVPLFSIPSRPVEMDRVYAVVDGIREGYELNAGKVAAEVERKVREILEPVMQQLNVGSLLSDSMDVAMNGIWEELATAVEMPSKSELVDILSKHIPVGRETVEQWVREEW